jgi:hypothetical protein
MLHNSLRAGTPHAARTAAEPGDPQRSLFMVSMSWRTTIAGNNPAPTDTGSLPHRIGVGQRDPHRPPRILIDHQDISSAASRQARHRTQLSSAQRSAKISQVGSGPKTRPADDFSFAVWASPRTPASSSVYPDGCWLAAPRKSAGSGPRWHRLTGSLAAAFCTFAIGQVKGQATVADLLHRQCRQPTGVCGASFVEALCTLRKVARMSRRRSMCSNGSGHHEPGSLEAAAAVAVDTPAN